jgi:serine/threonine protein kinase
MTPSVGDRLAGRYEIRAVVADRPTGVLYRGFDAQIGVEVALRVIDEGLLLDGAQRRAFVTRTARAKTLQHPNLMRLYDVLLAGDAAVLVMQWAPGERLSRRMANGPLPMGEGRVVLRRVAAGIAHAHAHGVVLGNIRPDTVMLYPDGLKLTNVGIGPALPRALFLEAMARKGELHSLAPEIVEGKEPDERSDVYGLALLAKTLVVSAPESSAPSAIRATRPIIEQALSGDPADRPRDPEAFARELDAAIDGRHVEPAGAPPVPTGSDTERVGKIDPSFVFAQATTGEELVLEPRTPLELAKSHGAEGDAPTNPRGRKRPDVSPETELKVEELVEVPQGAAAGEGQTLPLPRIPLARLMAPEITDVGHRSPVRVSREPGERPVQDPARIPVPVGDENETTRKVSRAQIVPAAVAPVEEQTTAPRARVPTPTRSRVTTPTRVPTANPASPTPPPTPVASPIPSPIPTPATTFASTLTPPGSVLAISTGQLPSLPSDVRRAEQHQRTMLVLIVLGMSVGVMGVAALWRLATPTPTIVLGPGATVMNPPGTPTAALGVPSTPTPATTPTRTPIPAPAPTPAPTEAASACPLGMAELSSPHRFCIDQYEYPGGHTIPRTQISRADAAQICTGRGFRLCADPEWEQACRGSANASYPYGQHFDPQRCNIGGRMQQIGEAGSAAHCRSAAGAYDMSGNVAEWTASGNQRGGSAYSAPANARCSHVVRGADPGGAADVGFRCCADLR